MIERPSSGMGLDELREEFDWISEFQSRMAERICGDSDVHNLVDYVGKLESENAKMREKVQRQADELTSLRKAIEQRNGEWRPWKRQAERFVAENAKLRELVRDMMGFFEDGDWCVRCERARDCQAQEQYEDDCLMRFVFRDRMRELGVETYV